MPYQDIDDEATTPSIAQPNIGGTVGAKDTAGRLGSKTPGGRRNRGPLDGRNRAKPARPTANGFATAFRKAGWN